MQYLYCIILLRSDNMKKRITFTFDEEVIEYLKEISEQTMIPQSRLAEQAIKEYLDKIKTTKN